jgi:foldase protein PrsA
VKSRPRFPAAVAAVLAVALALAACGSEGPFAATVDGHSISEESLSGELRSIAANERYLASIETRLPVRGSGQGAFDEALSAEVLRRLIFYSLMDREVTRRKLRITDQDLATARAALASRLGSDILAAFPRSYQDMLVEREARVNALTISLAGQEATDEAARTYYESHTDEFTQACVSHILVSTRERADQIKGRLAAGESFEAVARAESQDSVSALKNGDLGCDFTPGASYPPDFLAAAFSQPVGEVGNPVQTTFGFHLIRVTQRGVPPFENVVGQAREKLVAAGQAKLQEWLNGAIEQASIRVNPKFGTFRKSGISSVVVPPEEPMAGGGGAATTPTSRP